MGNAYDNASGNNQIGQDLNAYEYIALNVALHTSLRDQVNGSGELAK